jgi:SseB protein N-terminal domain
MLPIDPADDPGSVYPTPPLSHIVPPQAMPHGSTIIRPGAVAWGGKRNAQDTGYSSWEGIERTLTSAASDPGALPALLAELATARLWVPLPPRQRPLTDGAAVRLPVVGYQGTDFVPCFTSVQRLEAWAELAGPQRAGDARVLPHIVVPAAGLAGRLPAGVGLALNPGSAVGLPLYPECVPLLTEVPAIGQADPQVVDAWVACNTRRLYTCD